MIYLSAVSSCIITRFSAFGISLQKWKFISNKIADLRVLHSALSLSSNTTARGSARSTRLMQKSQPSKLWARGKRQTRLRNVKSYVDAVCSGLQGFEAQVQESHFEEPPCQENEGGGGDRRIETERAAAHGAQYCERPQAVSRSSSSPQSMPPSGTFAHEMCPTWPINLSLPARDC